MATEYSLDYSPDPARKFPTRAGIETFLRDEENAWKPFLSAAEADGRVSGLSRRMYGAVPTNISSVFDTLRARLDEPNQFNRSMHSTHRNLPFPPQSDTLRGQLILGLFEAGNLEHALSAYLHWLILHLNLDTPNDREKQALVDLGRELTVAAHAAAALPYQRVSSQRLAGAARAAENHANAMQEEIARAASINDDHSDKLDEMRSAIASKVRRGVGLLARRERRREGAYLDWRAGAEKKIETLLSDADERLVSMDRANMGSRRDLCRIVR